MSDEQVGGKLSQSLAKVKAQPKATTRPTRARGKASDPNGSSAPATRTTKARTSRQKTTNTTKPPQKDAPRERKMGNAMVGGLRVWPD